MYSEVDLLSALSESEEGRECSKHKALIISTFGWPTAARVAIALANVGYEVACTSPPGGLIRKTAAVSHHFSYRPWAKLHSISQSIKVYRPDILICADDQAVDDLDRLRRRVSKVGGDANVRLAKLISASLGDAANVALIRAKSEFVSWAGSTGLRCPKTVVVPVGAPGECVPKVLTYPAFVKADASTGGAGVKLVRNEQETLEAILDLSASVGWQALVKRILKPRYYWYLLRSGLLKRKRTVSLQQFILGSPANRAVFCNREGRFWRELVR